MSYTKFGWLLKQKCDILSFIQKFRINSLYCQFLSNQRLLPKAVLHFSWVTWKIWSTFSLFKRQMILKYKLPILNIWTKIQFWQGKWSILLALNFVEIKNFFTRTLISFNSKNFWIICYWKNTHENELI